MPSFNPSILFTPALVIFLATLWVAFRATRCVEFTLLVALVKAGMFFFYFGTLFDGTFTFLDDWSYLEGGADLYALDVGITNLPQTWNLVLATGGGDHFVYYLYNTYAIRLFGEGYYAPVALNILLTLLVASFGTRLAAREFGFSEIQQKWFFAFLLLHPDILAWSNIMNGKDILVLLMHVLLLFSGSLFFGGRTASAIALAIPVSVVLLFTRSYVPLLFSVAFLSSLVLAARGRGQLRLFVIAAFMFVAALHWLGEDGQQYALEAIREHFVNPFYGFLHFALTPIPFNTDLPYSFLNLPALIHWLLFPFACWGALMLYRLQTPFSRFFLLYILVFSCLYAVFDDLQGPRHRVQLDYGWAVLQFMGVIAFLRSVSAHQHPPRFAKVSRRLGR